MKISKPFTSCFLQKNNNKFRNFKQTYGYLNQIENLILFTWHSLKTVKKGKAWAKRKFLKFSYLF